MHVEPLMKRARVTAVMVLGAVLVSCSPATPASPTAKPAITADAAKPAASPAASPAVAAVKPAASPAASPAAGAAGAPLAKPTFNEQAVADFYRGKTIKIIVGFAPGGGYDTFARVVAKHMPKYLPGSPTFIVENRPGAGSIVAANAVYSTEPKDGTVIAAFAELVVLSQAAGGEGISFDSVKFNWLGANTRTAGTCMVRKDSGINNIADVQARQANTPSTGRGSSANDFPAVLNGVLDTKFKLILGYQGYPEAQAAFEKNEGEALCGTVDVLVTRQRRLVEGNDAIARMIIHSGAPNPDMSDPLMNGVPNAMDMLKTEEDKQILRAFNVPLQMVRPLAVAPEVPADRVTALRYSLAQVFRDREFDADIKQITPTYTVEGTSTGEEVDAVVKTLFSTPAPALARLKQLLQ